MPVLTISAVDPVTNQLTIAAHGLNTGDGPATIYTPNGAIPGGLSAATDTYAIVVDANTIKLATSSTNALAGTAIDITSAGSGTLELLVGLPYRRARTYAAGSQLKSVDLNSLQDDDIALWNLLAGQPQSIFTGIALASGQRLKLAGSGDVAHDTYTKTFPAAAGAGNMAYSSLAARSSAGAQTWDVALTGFVAGDRFKSGSMLCTYSRSGGTVTFELLEVDIATGATNHVSGSITDGTTTGTQQKNLLSADYTALAGKFYAIRFTSGGTSDSFVGVSVSWDRP